MLCYVFVFVCFLHSCFDFVCKLIIILLEKIMLILELVFLVLCVIVQPKLLLILGFMILSLLVF